MAEEGFTVADFFRLAKETASHESELRIKEAEALANIRMKLAESGIPEDGQTTDPS